MEKFIINGGKKLTGTVSISGSKNVALKTLVAAALTQDEITIKNIPLISDMEEMIRIVKEIGGECKISRHTLKVKVGKIKKEKIPLEEGAKIRTSSMFLAPLLTRVGAALVPNPGGCRIGARPIDRTIVGLKAMGADIYYDSSDGYFHGKTKGLRGITYRFEKNTHTGTETLIIAGVRADGRTILENAAQEPEIDELIKFLNLMGAKIRRVARTIIIDGVKKLHGAKFTIGPDRNEVVTLGIAGILTGGDIKIIGIKKLGLTMFINKLLLAGCGVEEEEDAIRFYAKDKIKLSHIITSPYPGFMTDWQGPWAVLMTQAVGSSIIHETVYENRFSYVGELLKMGAKIELFNPKLKSPEKVYNFNWKDNRPEYFHAVRIYGPTKLHNAVVNIADLRAGATLVLAALAAHGESIVYGVEHIDRGYEDFDGRLRKLGADIKRAKD